jgi:Uma2 family endonuclease
MVQGMAFSARQDQAGDPTVYPVEERVGEDILQRLIVELLRPLVQRWLDTRGETALVGADQFIYWKQHDPLRRIAPDVYVLPGVRAGTDVPSWKVWETGVVPSFAVEVVSRDWEKDYVEAPTRYAELGVPEVLVFDPHAAAHAERVRFQLFRRVAGRPLSRIEMTQEDRVRSLALGAWVRAIGTGVDTRLRLATDPRGDELFPTGEEAERAAKDAALEEVERLRLRLAELERRK